MVNKTDERISGREWRISEWFQSLTDDTRSKLKAYHEELIKFNGRINLISPKSEKTADLFHFADGIMGSQEMVSASNPNEVYDIGSGNGLPGIILSILYPNIKVILLDADARKIEFLKHCIHILGLPNASVIHGRCEDLDASTIHFGVCRGLASISKTLLLVRKAAAKGCIFHHFKGETWPREIAEVPPQILAHWDIISTHDYVLPNKTTKLTVVVTKKK